MKTVQSALLTFFTFVTWGVEGSPHSAAAAKEIHARNTTEPRGACWITGKDDVECVQFAKILIRTVPGGTNLPGVACVKKNDEDDLPCVYQLEFRRRRSATKVLTRSLGSGTTSPSGIAGSTASTRVTTARVSSNNLQGFILLPANIFQLPRRAVLPNTL